MAQTKDDSKYIVRFPEGLRQEVKEIAATNRRSMNAEIITYIERGIASANQTKKGEVTA